MWDAGRGVGLPPLPTDLEMFRTSMWRRLVAVAKSQTSASRRLAAHIIVLTGHHPPAAPRAPPAYRRQQRTERVSRAEIPTAHALWPAVSSHRVLLGGRGQSSFPAYSTEAPLRFPDLVPGIHFASRGLCGRPREAKRYGSVKAREVKWNIAKSSLFCHICLPLKVTISQNRCVL